MGFKFSIGAAILMLVAFMSNTFFLQSTLTRSYEASDISQFMLQSIFSRDRIQIALNSKQRKTIAEIRRLLEAERKKFSSDVFKTDSTHTANGGTDNRAHLNLSIVLKNGITLIGTSDDEVDVETAENIAKKTRDLLEGHGHGEQDVIDNQGRRYVPQLLFDNTGQWIGALVVTIDREYFAQSTKSKLYSHFSSTLLIGVVCATYVLLMSLLLPKPRQKNNAAKKQFVAMFIVVMGVTLFWSIIWNIGVFQQNALDISKSAAADVARHVSIDPGADEKLLTSYIRSFPEIESISTVNGNNRLHVENSSLPKVPSFFETIVGTYVLSAFSESDLTISTTMNSGHVLVQISPDDIASKATVLLSNGLTMILVSIFITVELLVLYIHVMSKHFKGNDYRQPFELGFVRPALFVFLFGVDLSMAFVPLHMQSFDVSQSWISENVMYGLPISAEFLFVGIFILIAGAWIDRRGWLEPFMIGVVLAGIGSFLSWLVTDPIQFIASRALIGAGFGLTLMSCQGLVVALSGPKKRALGLANLFAGLYAGSICGAATGSIIAENTDYNFVFLLGALIIFAVVPVSILFKRSKGKKQTDDTTQVQQPKTSVSSLVRFIFHPAVLGLSLLSSMPSSIAIAGFLNYFTPVYLDEIGSSESTIGQVLILYGICLILIGPLIGKLIDKSSDKKYYMFAGAILGGLAFITFDESYGMISVIVAVLLLGLSTSFVLPSQSTMILELDVSKKLGDGKSLGIFRSISRIGQVIGPLLFSWILFAGQTTEYINYLGIIYVAGVLPLAILLIKPKRRDSYVRTSLQTDS